MNIDPCSECGGALAPEQRYCLNCGNRVAPPLALPYIAPTPAAAAAPAGAVAATAAAAAAAPAAGPPGTLFGLALPMPLQMAGVFAALALGFGVVVGTALSPSLTNLAAAPQQVVEQPPEAAPEPAPTPSKGGGGGATTTADTGSSDTGGGFFGTTGDTTGGDTGGGSKKPKKQKPEKPVYVSGTVVHGNPVAGSYAVASGGGLSSVHTSKGLPTPGTKVRVPVTQLNNRTFSEDGKRQVKGQATTAGFGGIVTDNRDSTDPAIPDEYTVSSRGASILIHSPPDVTPTTTDVPPPIGKLVTATVDIRNAVPTPLPPAAGAPPTCTPPPQPLPSPAVVPVKELIQTAVTIDPAPVASTEIETVIQHLCPGAPGDALLSTDDVREGKTDVQLTAAGIDMSLLSTGQPIIATVTFVDDPSGPPGTRKLGAVTGAASDQGAEGADDQTAAQGDLARSARG